LKLGIGVFTDKLSHAWSQQQSLLCVGLDPDPARIPAEIMAQPKPFLEFLTAIVDATHTHCAAFKPQFAHFAAQGRESELAELMAYIGSRYPAHVRILDAKRGDVGSTAAFYAVEAYARYDADTVTLNPYLGKEAIDPFLAYGDRGIVVLCRTSNPSSDWLQKVGEPPTFLRVAKTVSEWNTSGQCMLVAGATYPAELAQIRAAIGDMPMLVPGIGAQGGDLEAVLQNGMTTDKTGLLISSSRSILYASSGNDFATQSAHAAKRLNDQINAIRL
jgi:orotidine-5'-phosphate decarboxylase